MCRDRHYLQVKQAASYVWNVDIAGLFTDATDNTRWVSVLDLQVVVICGYVFSGMQTPEVTAVALYTFRKICVGYMTMRGKDEFYFEIQYVDNESVQR